MNWALFSQLALNGMIIGTLYGVVAMCFVLIYKASQVVNFAQGEFLLIGAWVCWFILTEFQIPFVWGFLLTLAFMMVFGILLQVVVLRPMIGEPVISVIMVTIGLSIFFQALMNWLFGVFVQPFPPIFQAKSIDIFGLSVQPIYLLGMAISAMVSALAGVVVGVVNGVSSALSLIGIKVFPAVILGGLDSIVGAVVGGLIIGLLENLAEFADSQYLHVGNMFAVAPFYVLIIILMVKPYGLFGTRDIERI